jgi:hypothetical protein
MINVNYQKRKNSELFKSLEKHESLFLSETQNYIPIYTKFFSLNETNYNNINLNNKWYIHSINEQIEDNDRLYNCRVKNINNNKIKDKEIFFKLAPLLDPYKFLIGKYNINDERFLTLPKIDSTETVTHTKFLDINNSAYVDGLFLFLTSNLIHQNNFVNGVDYYGSFLAIKNNFNINVFDDIDYLNGSEFFNKNKNKLFTIDDYEHLFNEEEDKLKPITIQHDLSSKSKMSIKSFDNHIFEDIFEDNISLDNLKDMSIDLIDITNSDMLNNDDKNVTLKSNSTCSSRSSHTSLDEMECENNSNCDEEEDDSDEEQGDDDDDDEQDDDGEGDDSEGDDSEGDDGEGDDDEEEEYKEEIINATIPKFPVQVICMENCEKTFDDLILTSELTTEEWYSALMQIVMILITYQKAFNFTHNDLHTNNVMYVETDKKYLHYCYKKKYYKVPTFGRIFKIIDFGRSIYKFNGNIFCSDSFNIGGDAATQYNTEPYFNDKKPRLEPNFSFDLCRLACSIYDYVIDETDDIKDVSKFKDPIKKLIVEWCLDDKGINMLYKNNGDDRYPDFKLYKMISRCVHNHTPQSQLERPEFKKFSNFKGDIPIEQIIDIDKIPIYF